MNKIRLLLPFFVLFAMFTRCDQIQPDDFTRTVGTLYLEEIDGYDFSIKIDGGATIVSDDYEFLLSNFKDSTRVMFYFSEIGSYKGNDDIQLLTKIRDVQKLIVKPVYFFDDETSDDEIDSIGTSNVDIISAWILDDYLNIQFNYYGSGRSHRFDLVFDETNPLSSLDEIYVSLRHQNYNDPVVDEYFDVISFDISALQVYHPKSFDIRLEAIGYDDYYYSNSFLYEYGDESE